MILCLLQIKNAVFKFKEKKRLNKNSHRDKRLGVHFKEKLKLIFILNDYKKIANRKIHTLQRATRS